MEQRNLFSKAITGWSLFLMIIFLIGSINAQNGDRSATLEELTGKYLKDNNELIYIFTRNGELRVRPVFWQSIQPLIPATGLNFVVSDRRNRKVNFFKDKDGQITKLEVIGFGREDGVYQKISDEKPASLELLFNEDPVGAVDGLIKSGAKDPQMLTLLGYRFWFGFPSKRENATKYFEHLVKYYPDHADLRAALGHSYVTSNEREKAVKSYRAALKINPKNDDAIYGLAHLNELPESLRPKEKGWELPFSLDKLFAPPRADEIKAVTTDWTKRDLTPKNVLEIARTEVNLGYSDFLVRIISHEIAGFRHYGAIFTPIAKDKTVNRNLPVILELKGVSADFFPLNISQGPESAGFLGDRQGDFIYFVPSYRGEILIMNGVRFQSQGDRTNVWDGATDDALSFLNVGLDTSPEADPTKIISFGRSRGGTIAMLAGIRSEKIAHAYSWAGPTDWFELMGKQGWTLKERVRYTLSKKSESGSATQFVETFLTKALAGQQSLEETRQLMIASSPLYFTGNLKSVQLHYGIEDWIVPLVNGTAFEEKLKKEKIKYEAVYYENAGHDLDLDKASANAKKFFVSVLENKR